jgi:hypothetical protein
LSVPLNLPESSPGGQQPPAAVGSATLSEPTIPQTKNSTDDNAVLRRRGAHSRDVLCEPRAYDLADAPLHLRRHCSSASFPVAKLGWCGADKAAEFGQGQVALAHL